MNEIGACRAIPFKTIFDTRRSNPLDHKSNASRLRPLWRMSNVGRQEKHAAFLNWNLAVPAILDGPEHHVALELEEEFLMRIIMVISSYDWSHQDHHQEVAVSPDRFVGHRWRELGSVIFDPLH